MTSTMSRPPLRSISATNLPEGESSAPWEAGGVKNAWTGKGVAWDDSAPNAPVTKPATITLRHTDAPAISTPRRNTAL